MKKTLFILCGEAFSGKSTLAKEIASKYEAKIIGRDEIYFATEKILALENTPEEDDDNLWNNLWPLVLQGSENQLSLGNSVVIDDNCFYLKQRDELRSIAKKADAEVVLIYLDTPQEVIKKRKEENKRNKTRHDVPSAWLEEDRHIFERPSEAEKPIVYNPGKAIEELLGGIQ